MNLGTRSNANVKGGGVQVYLGDAQTLSAQSAFGATMTTAAFATLLADFDNVGQTADKPSARSEPNTYDKVDSNGNKGKSQLSSNIKAEIVLHETDNDIINALMALAEAGTHIDILLVKGQAANDYVTYYRDVPFSIKTTGANSFEEPDTAAIMVDVTVKNVYDVHGQLKLTAA